MDEEQRKPFVEIWADHVGIRDMVIAILLCVVPAMAGYILAPSEPPLPLALGLTGAFIGFIIACIIIKPKRKLHEEQAEE
ncbi:hypothetical protein JCM19037_4407 [Geomicrobium sp. JCM 19037]|uniref:hypothetical protein n=1 Tax=unclassified Geomicrobium TaxID=2628951 RepID=UPI00045F16C9|nr:hypothetical protein [Geomicrobium sp. JCM 19037]GAK05874.1 hypothetical protein JCM19037_4407 [Geomicrobium sp. JCM 19037]